ncbi:methyl-accepting chemotaxis protein [Bacillus toyonensis]|uniref:methyl-accepting chemotaxis protein n=1 Tax=Bacillus toyonensis TaxID=155322 RepID=UPI002E1C38D5|nr:methyl-accepting chemotaxis protein [Bacillus toyonensis]
MYRLLLEMSFAVVEEGDELRTISKKIVGVLTISLTASFLMTNALMYYSVYDKTLEAAGIEAYGCANITTGLLNPEDVQKVLKGDKETIEKVGDQIEWTVKHKDIFDAQYILDLNGNIVASDSNLIKSGSKIGDKHPIDPELIHHLKDMKHPVFSKVYKFNGKEKVTGFAPIFKDQDPNKEVVAISAIDFDAAIVTQRTLETIGSSVLLSAIPLLLVLVVTALFVNRIIKPIRIVSDKVNEVSKGDLSKEELLLKNKDEIGMLAEDFNSLTGRFKDIIGDVSLNTAHLAATSEELYASAQNISSISDKNTNRLVEVNDMSETQSNHMTEIATIIHNLSSHIQIISEQLNTFSSISKNTVEEAIAGEGVIQETNHQMQNIVTKIETLTQTMMSLQLKSKKIDKIIEVISEGSDQTNIISMNAAIEANKAGESGRGFAVVAGEVRRLAEESSSSTAMIRELLNEIQKEINEALNESKEGNKEANEGMSKVKEAGESFNQISTRIKLVSQEISTASESVESVSSEIEEIIEKMDHIVKLLDNTTKNIYETSTAINDQNSSFKEIVDVTNSISKTSEQLKEIIGYFKI